MNDVGIIFGLVKELAKYKVLKEENKYLDEILELEKRWLHEYNKPSEEISDFNLDTIKQQLRLISAKFITSVRK